MKNARLLFFLAFVFGLPLNAQEGPSWLRHPAISPDGTQIAFTHKGDLYKVAVTGGLATQLTYHTAHDYMAVWSKDGDKIAFASDRYGNFDVFVMPAIGGTAERLTFHSGAELPYTFTADDSAVLFGALRQDDVAHRQYPHRSQSELYAVPVTGGRVAQLMTLPAEYVQVSKDGNTLLYHDKKGGEDEYRKHQTSSITRDIWAYDLKQGTHRQLTTAVTEDRHPVYTSDESGFYYLSEASGTFQVHKRMLAGGQDEQLTDFRLHPVRSLSLGNGTLCFSFDGELYTMPEGGQPRKVPVTIITQDKANDDTFLSISGGVTEMEVSPDGKEIAFIARGEVFVTSVGESFTKRLTNTPQQERFVTWGPEGKSVVYSSERDGKWGIYATKKTRAEEPFFYAATVVTESPVLVGETENYLASYSPDGKKMAYVADRRNIRVRDLATGTEVSLMDQQELFHMRDGDKYFTWSPDSEWLLVEWDVSLSNSEVLLMKADGSKRVNLNESGYYDARPKWVNEGKQMIWFSNRDGLKSYATSGRSEQDVYSLFFTREAWDEFNLSDEEFKLAKAIKEAAKKEKEGDKKDEDKEKKEDKKAEKKEVKQLTFDWDDMDERTKRLTIHSSRLGDAVLSKDGETLYYLATFEKAANLWSTNLRTKATKMEMEIGSNGRLEWDKELKNLYLLSGGTIAKLDLEKSKKTPIKIKEEMVYDVAAERQAMFDHVWIRTNAIFYEPTFHGIDWALMKTEYGKYLPSIGNAFELTEMLSEMLGELNVSHAGARYRPQGITNPDATASLGVFMNYDHTGNGILIDEVMAGGPLDKAAFKVKKGTIIEAINGETIVPDRDVASYLNRLADKFTLLELIDPATKKRDTITVKPISLAEENGLLYKRWVKQNEREVNEKSNGTLGYVHIPGMGDGPYRDIYEDMMGKYLDRKAMIVDTRFNGGGDLVADLAMFFTGVPFITYATEAKVVGGEPTSRWTKPTLALINEAQYSDGHCFACGYTDLKIGTTVGMPTPGTCSFAGWESLPDGSVWGVVPVSAKDINGNWMENNQTEPMIRVKNMPGVIDRGRDEQLERAILELMK